MPELRSREALDAAHEGERSAWLPAFAALRPATLAMKTTTKLALAFGAPVVQAVRSSLFKDVHLMVDEPLHKLPEFVRAGADVVTVHVEAERHIHRVFQELSSMRNANDPARGLVRGVALNTGTPLETLDPDRHPKRRLRHRQRPRGAEAGDEGNPLGEGEDDGGHRGEGHHHQAEGDPAEPELPGPGSVGHGVDGELDRRTDQPVGAVDEEGPGIAGCPKA